MFYLQRRIVQASERTNYGEPIVSKFGKYSDELCDCEGPKSHFKRTEISFLFKYVDDISGAMIEKSVETLEMKLNSAIRGLKVKREVENEMRSISYLNCEINRREDNTIAMKWCQKGCSSRQILNFHSNHPYHVKMNVVREFIDRAIRVTTDDHMNETVKKLMVTMNRSSYPPNFYEKLIANSLRAVGKLQTTSIVGNPDNQFDCEMELFVRSLGGKNRIFKEFSKNFHRVRRMSDSQIMVRS